MKPAIELIDWYDHYAFQKAGWKDPNEVEKMMKGVYPKGLKVRSVGHVVHETKDTVCLSGTMSEDGEISGEIMILKRVVFNRQVLKKGSK
jgi:hypothetical protein